LKDDIPLFENIMSDLFPGVEKPVVDIGHLLSSINNSIEQKKLVNIDVCIEKII